MPTDDDGDRDRDRDLDTMVADLHRHLEATAELPIDPRTNRWLGEAEAVAGDAALNDLAEAPTRKRVSQVAHLLEEADQTGHDEADDHLDAARSLCDRILEDRD